MKKTLIVALMMVAGVAQANVLCEVITKAPGYNVASYVRSQSACVTTNYAGASSVGTQLARLGTMVVVASAVVYLADQYQKARIENILSGDYKTLTCSKYSGHPSIKSEVYEFLVGKDYAINKGTGNSYSRSSVEGVYERGMFTSYRLDINTMKVTGNGLAGVADLNCSLNQEVRNGKLVNEDTAAYEVVIEELAKVD